MNFKTESYDEFSNYMYVSSQLDYQHETELYVCQ